MDVLTSGPLKRLNIKIVAYEIIHLHNYITIIHFFAIKIYLKAFRFLGVQKVYV